MPEQGKEIGQDVFQAAVEGEHFPRHFLLACPFLILRLNLKVTLEQFDKRQIGRGFAMRNRKRFQDQATAL